MPHRERWRTRRPRELIWAASDGIAFGVCMSNIEKGRMIFREMAIWRAEVNCRIRKLRLDPIGSVSK